MSLAAVLKLAAAITSGFNFHGCLYMSIIEHPSRSSLPFEGYVGQWSASCQQTKMFMLSSEIFTLISTVVLYFVDNIDQSNLWLICPAGVLATCTWTILMILPELKLTTMENVHEQKEYRWIRTKVDLIMRRHVVRIALNLVVHLTVLGLSCSR